MSTKHQPSDFVTRRQAQLDADLRSARGPGVDWQPPRGMAPDLAAAVRTACANLVVGRSGCWPHPAAAGAPTAEEA